MRRRPQVSMDFQIVVLAGGFSKTLLPLVSKDLPKALLPVADRPVLSFVLELLEQNGIKEAIVVVEGESAALLISAWISRAFEDRLNVEVVAVREDVGTAGAIREIGHRLTTKDILVVSGDLVTEIPLGAVAAVHRRHDAMVTAMLCSVPISGPLDSGASSVKDKGKKAGRLNIVGLDPTKTFLVHIASGAEVEKDIRIHKGILRAFGQMEIRSDLMDAHMYAFKRSALLDVLRQNEKFHSLRRDVLPYLVQSQLKSSLRINGSQSEENGNDKDALHIQQNLFSQLANAPHLLSDPILNQTHKCVVYIANKTKYCARLNSVQAFSDINRDIVGDANHLLGYTLSAQNNVVDPSVILGSKTTVGPQCMVREGSEMGDKCSIKKSIIGRHCRIGSNVKISNSIIMNHVTIGDGCSVQGSIICSNVQIQERASLKDCQVGAGYVVTANGDYKGESLAKKEK